MKYLVNTSSFLIGIGLIFSATFQINAQFKPLTTTGRMVESNVPVLDSLEKVSYPKMVQLEDPASIENPSQRRFKKKVEVRLFQVLNASKFQLYVDNKLKQKVTLRVLDRSGILIFEDGPYEKDKFQRIYDLAMLKDIEEYYFTVFYEDQDHYFFPIRLETKESFEELAKLNTEYPLEIGKN
jgi:hypothetical protein